MTIIKPIFNIIFNFLPFNILSELINFNDTVINITKLKYATLSLKPGVTEIAIIELNPMNNKNVVLNLSFLLRLLRIIEIRYNIVNNIQYIKNK